MEAKFNTLFSILSFGVIMLLGSLFRLPLLVVIIGIGVFIYIGKPEFAVLLGGVYILFDRHRDSMVNSNGNKKDSVECYGVDKITVETSLIPKTSNSLHSPPPSTDTEPVPMSGKNTYFAQI